MTQPSRRSRGRRLLTAVERLVDDSDSLVAQVAAFSEDVDALGHRTGSLLHRDAAAARIIRAFSNRSALAGGVSALPAMFLGAGTAIAVVGGSLADMTIMLKQEVEMALCLTHLYGHDIRVEKERWLGYTLAAVGTYEAQSGRNFFVDIADAQLEAVAKYTPRQLSKLVATAFGKYALLSVSRGFFRAMPLVGVAVSASTNKLMLSSTGWKCVDALERLRMAEHNDFESVVDAEVI